MSQNEMPEEDRELIKKHTVDDRELPPVRAIMPDINYLSMADLKQLRSMMLEKYFDAVRESWSNHKNYTLIMKDIEEIGNDHEKLLNMKERYVELMRRYKKTDKKQSNDYKMVCDTIDGILDTEQAQRIKLDKELQQKNMEWKVEYWLDFVKQVDEWIRKKEQDKLDNIDNQLNRNV